MHEKQGSAADEGAAEQVEDALIVGDTAKALALLQKFGA